MNRFTLTDGNYTTRPEEYLFYKSGIPRRFWRTKREQLRFGTLKINKQNVSAATQRQQLQAALIEPARQLVVIGSTPTDEGALAAGFWTLRNAIQRGYRVAALDVQYDQLREEDREHLPRFILLHNVLARCTDDRAQHIRDILLRYPFCARIVTVATDNPYMFSTQRIGLSPTGCCLLRDVS